jgi:hypothetical protein
VISSGQNLILCSSLPAIPRKSSELEPSALQITRTAVSTARSLPRDFVNIHLPER